MSARGQETGQEVVPVVSLMEDNLTPSNWHSGYMAGQPAHNRLHAGQRQGHRRSNSIRLARLAYANDRVLRPMCEPGWYCTASFA